MKRNPFPEDGELVVCSIKEVKDFGAFGTLDEYPGKEGFIHVSEVASGWVKYVRDHVREGSKVVCKVLKVDEKRGHVDLSLKRVNEHQKRETIAEWKNAQKAQKLMEILGREVGKPVEELYETFGFDLEEAFGTLYAAFEAAAIDPEMLKEEGFESPDIDAFGKLAGENISIPFVTITGYLDVSNPSADGVDRIKEALKAAGGTEYEDVTIDVQYMGAPRYRLRVTAPDYKVAEDEMSKAAERVVEVAKGNGGEALFMRELDEE